MSKRPWDRSNKGRGQTLKTRDMGIPNTGGNDDAISDTIHIPSSEVPYIDVDGIKYYSDRFYLHRTASDPPVSKSGTTSSSSAHSAYCSCKVPPLLDRVKLINSLDLKAVICATYTLDLAWMATAFPEFGASVPTLILHGQKGLTNKMEEQRKVKHQECDSSSDEEDFDDCEIAAKTATGSDENNPPEEGLGNAPQPEFQYDTLGPLLHLTQVLPRWLPRSKQSPEASREDRRKHSEARLGVHHPKYFILFATDGSVIVIVSTGNLTCPRATDASWMQRFEPTTPSSSGRIKIPRSQQRRNGSDFGAVLSDFLKCQSDAVEKRGLLPEEFLKKYMDYDSLSTLEQSYQFFKAQVHLIATVPGDYESRFAREHLKRDGDFVDFLYGRQRVADIVSRLSENVEEKRWRDDAWFPEALLSKYDRLIFQPTSIGAHWTLRNLSNVVRSYLGNDDKTKVMGSTPSSTKKQKGSKNKYSDAKYCGDDQKILERLDIVWPSMKLMKMIARSTTTITDSPRSVVDIDNTGEAQNDSSGTKSDESAAISAFCFMASKSFNLIQPACLSQLVMYVDLFS